MLTLSLCHCPKTDHRQSQKLRPPAGLGQPAGGIGLSRANSKLRVAAAGAPAVTPPRHRHLSIATGRLRAPPPAARPWETLGRKYSCPKKSNYASGAPVVHSVAVQYILVELQLLRELLKAAEAAPAAGHRPQSQRLAPAGHFSCQDGLLLVPLILLRIGRRLLHGRSRRVAVCRLQDGRSARGARIWQVRASERGDRLLLVRWAPLTARTLKPSPYDAALSWRLNRPRVQAAGGEW